MKTLQSGHHSNALSILALFLFDFPLPCPAVCEYLTDVFANVELMFSYIMHIMTMSEFV